MFANRVHETSSTVGTGDITLLGAEPNLRTFTSQFILDIPVSYLIDDEAGNFEAGVGHLSGTTTLVRDTVLDSSNAGALVNFGAGTKQIFCVNSAHLLTPASPIPDKDSFGTEASGGLFSRGASSSSAGSNVTLNGDRINLIPYFWDGFDPITSLTIMTASSVTATKARIGIYSWGSTGFPAELLAETGDITPVASTTIVTAITGGPVTLRRGWYFSAILLDGNLALEAHSGSAFWRNPWGSRDNTANPTPFSRSYQLVSGGWSQLPDASTITIYNSINAADNFPAVRWDK